MTRPELIPVDIVGECIPIEKKPNPMQQMIDEGLAFWDVDGEFCLSMGAAQVAQTVKENGDK
jgi:hypothetical protein